MSTTRYSGYSNMNSIEDDLNGGPATVFALTIIDGRIERGFGREQGNLMLIG